MPAAQRFLIYQHVDGGWYVAPDDTIGEEQGVFETRESALAWIDEHGHPFAIEVAHD